MIQNGYIHVVEFTSGSMTISAGKSTVRAFASPFSSLQRIFPWYYDCWKTRYREEFAPSQIIIEKFETEIEMQISIQKPLPVRAARMYP